MSAVRDGLRPAWRTASGATTQTARRLGFLDALRGVAVGLVLVQHAGELLFPSVRGLSTTAVQLGQSGVVVFFLCSGFIIPASLERGGGGASRWSLFTRFWRGRFLRLYPMYWVALGAALLLSLAGRYGPGSSLGPAAWALNATMAQALLGVPQAIGVAWTLTFELLFYLGTSLLFLLGWHRRSVVLSLAASAVCLALAAAVPLLGHPAPLGIFCVATMVTGTVVQQWHAGEVRLRTVAGCAAAALGAGTALLCGTLLGHDQPHALGDRSFVPMLAAWWGAYAVFGVGVALRGRTAPRWLRRLGVLSYSVYLVHPLVLAAVPRTPLAPVTMTVWLSLTVALAELTHRWVERPALLLGRGSRAVAVPVPRPTDEPVPASPAPLAA